MERIRILRKTDPVKARKLQRRLKYKANKRSDRDEKDTRSLLSSMDDVDSTDNEDVNYITMDVDEEVPDSLSELKAVMEKFVEMEKTRGSGRDRNEWDEWDDRPMMDDTDRLGTGYGTNKEDAFADDADDEKQKAGMSSKKLKKLRRPTVSQLKQICARPEVVESWDTTAPDPATLVFLKSYRNSVPVPAHWSHKRKYLQGKRGLDKTNFKLPHYIEATRISEIRSAIEEKDAQKTLKQKMREKVRPRHRKMNIDYQVLHDAFFKYATKPHYTRFGDLYFEGKEAEMQMRKYAPGRLSERAKEALGMTNPVDSSPWLLNMQRYGPPPSYPNLIVPGVNAHIPEGASLGFQSGGWGRPPTLDQLHEWGVTPRFDEVVPVETMEEASQQMWGQLLTVESSEEESEHEEAAEMQDDFALRAGTETPDTMLLAPPVSLDPSGLTSVASTTMLLGEGLRSATGMSSVTSGLDTPQSVDISGFMSGATPRPYTILESQKAPAQPGALFTTDMVYLIPNQQANTLPSSAMLGGTATPFTST